MKPGPLRQARQDCHRLPGFCPLLTLLVIKHTFSCASGASVLLRGSTFVAVRLEAKKNLKCRSVRTSDRMKSTVILVPRWRFDKSFQNPVNIEH